MKIKRTINRSFEIELYDEDGKQYIHLSTDGASGCKYLISDTMEIGERVADYIYDYYMQDAEE